MPTIKDVARASGVSTTTVSFVLNNSRAVGADARARVLAAARTLGYTPNPLARGLSTGRAQTLGVLVRDFSSRIATDLMIGVEVAARQRGYKILPALYDRDPDSALSVLEDLAARRMDGIISICANINEHPAVLDALATTGLPHALAFHRPRKGARVDSIIPDNGQGGEWATGHLLDAGRTRVAFAGGPTARNATRERLDGFRAAHAARNLPPPDPSCIVFGDGFSVAGGLACGRQLFSGPPDLWPDAVFAVSDHIAAGCLRVCRARGLRVPGDVAVIGFDDHAMCEALDPPLSTVRLPLDEIGRRCVERLLLRLDAPDAWEPATLALPCQLVIRESA